MKTKIQQKIDVKTKLLIRNIERFKGIEKSFKKEIIEDVKDLIDLHRIDNPEYTFSNLLQEKKLQDYSDVLETYVPYDVSPLVNDQYIKGNLSNTDMMVLKHTDEEFKQPEQQRKIVEGIITKTINSKDLIRASKNEIAQNRSKASNNDKEEKNKNEEIKKI